MIDQQSQYLDESLGNSCIREISERAVRSADTGAEFEDQDLGNVDAVILDGNLEGQRLVCIRIRPTMNQCSHGVEVSVENGPRKRRVLLPNEIVLSRKL